MYTQQQEIPKGVRKLKFSILRKDRGIPSNLHVYRHRQLKELLSNQHYLLNSHRGPKYLSRCGPNWNDATRYGPSTSKSGLFLSFLLELVLVLISIGGFRGSPTLYSVTESTDSLRALLAKK